MGKRKESGTEEELIIDSPPGSSHKKHKKHKKKHKKKKEGDLEELSSPKPSIKLKLRIGGETLGTKSVQTINKESSDESQDQIIDVMNDSSASIEIKEEPTEKKPDVDTSDEEKQWLDALEKGNLDDSGMLRRSKDPKMLTARQRALFHGDQQELMQLPSGYRQVELTEEQMAKRQQRAKKRRQQAHEKREKDKKQTLDRLLKKQESKNKSMKTKSSKKSTAPKVHYVNNQNGITISVPTGIQFPFTTEKANPPKPKTRCGVKGCSNLKKYSCSKTGVPLCSLQCYKTNISVCNRPIKIEVV
ncbi:INO80 complex subunit B-like [Mytilus galloprovincialis]|uniref:INO80 complex subunit B-like n=1 Tax=Mytilus galloprovincialis TaxID=29158 RepID=UPI003F7C8D2E